MHMRRMRPRLEARGPDVEGHRLGMLVHEGKDTAFHTRVVQGGEAGLVDRVTGVQEVL
jgi:hypothetical protein